MTQLKEYYIRVNLLNGQVKGGLRVYSYNHIGEAEWTKRIQIVIDKLEGRIFFDNYVEMYRDGLITWDERNTLEAENKILTLDEGGSREYKDIHMRHFRKKFVEEFDDVLDHNQIKYVGIEVNI